MKSPVRLERRLEQPKWLNWAIPLISLVAALILGAIVLLATGKNPWDVYFRIFERGFAGTRALSGSLKTATPLAFTGLCAAVARRAPRLRLARTGQDRPRRIFPHAGRNRLEWDGRREAFARRRLG